MKKMLLVGISMILLIPIAPLADWAYYRDQKPFIPPINYTGRLRIRNDAYGDGHFGAKRKGDRSHKGLDIYAPLNSEVIASKGGRAKVRNQKNGMGKHVIILHSGGYSTLYGHLSEYRVRDNGRVRQGTVIGYVGKTGNARYRAIKPHLHFEIRKTGKYLNPSNFIE